MQKAGARRAAVHSPRVPRYVLPRPAPVHSPHLTQECSPDFREERHSNLVPVPLGEVAPLPHVPRLLPAPVPRRDGGQGVGGEGVLAVVHYARQVVAVRPREALARIVLISDN